MLWAFGLVFCVGAVLVSYSDAATLRDHGVRAEAVVTGVHEGSRDSYVTVDFSTRTGRSVSAEVGNWDWSDEPHVGDMQTVLYDPSDPSGLVADTRQGPDFLATWLFAAGFVACLVLFVLTYSGRINWSGKAKPVGKLNRR